MNRHWYSFVIRTIIFLSIFYFGGCEPHYVEPTTDDSLTAEEVAVLDKIPAVQYPLEKIILPNGENVKSFLLKNDPAFLDANGGRINRVLEEPGPQEIKNLFIARMQVIGNNLTTQSNFDFSQDAGTNKPAHAGIGYSYGSKDFKKRKKPSAGKCTEEIHGLDCSGFVALLVQGAGLSTFPNGNAEKQRQISTWQNEIDKHLRSTKVRVEEVGANLKSSEMESGDIIFWERSNGTAFHIGVVLNAGTELGVFQSNGTDGTNKDDDCTTNYNNTKRGVSLKTLNDPDWFRQGKNYKVLRIIVDISGEWNMFLRCSGESQVAAELKFKIPIKTGGDFTAAGSGTDYDGTPLTISLKGSYNKLKNLLSATMVFSSVDGKINRNQKFQHKLNYDDTGYFITTKVDNSSGCDLQVRLVNKGK